MINFEKKIVQFAIKLGILLAFQNVQEVNGDHHWIISSQNFEFPIALILHLILADSMVEYRLEFQIHILSILLPPLSNNHTF